MRLRAVRAGIVATAVLASAIVLAGCGGSPAPVGTSPEPSAAPTSPAPTESVEPVETTAADPSCDTIIPEDTVADFADAGWTVQSQPFRAGSIELAGGIQCTWGDYTVATDHVQIFGWAPIDDAQTEDAIDELVASGWRREEGDGGVYVTESAETAIATDEDGYGLTYFFTEGSVEMADTKQSLLLVEWPPA